MKGTPLRIYLPSGTQIHRNKKKSYRNKHTRTKSYTHKTELHSQMRTIKAKSKQEKQNRHTETKRKKKTDTLIYIFM